jgi:hypothetical protein
MTAGCEQAIAKLSIDEQEVYRFIPGDLLRPIESYRANTWNPKKCPDDRLLGIAESLKQKGWLAHDLPLVWQPPRSKQFVILNGEHRWLVCRAAGFKSFPGVIAPGITDEMEARELTLVCEGAKARPDHQKFARELTTLALAGRDEALRGILRVNAERLRDRAEATKQRLEETLQERSKAGGPRMVSLVLTGTAHARWQEAMTKAKSVLKQATGATELVEALSAGDLVDLALCWREWQKGRQT